MLKNTTLIAAAIGAIFASSVLQAETLDTRIGKLEFTHDFADGYPTDATVKKLFNEMDFQRAVQAYLWAIPFASTAQWQYAHTEHVGAENGQAVFLESYKDRLGGLTYDATTHPDTSSGYTQPRTAGSRAPRAMTYCPLPDPRWA